MSGACRAVLIDLSGTLHIEDKAIPGAVEALEKLRQRKKVCFVTNTTKESKKSLLNRLLTIGFKVKENEIFSSLTATRKLITEKQLRPFLLLEDEAMEDFEGINIENSNAVVVGLAPSKFDYETMNTAFRLLVDGASLIAIHKGRYYKKKDGLAIGPGAYVSALEYAAGVTADVVGKPEADFFLSAIENIGSKASEAIMIGDDVKDDIHGAQNCRIKGILVKTGKYREHDENKISPPPYHVCNDFPEAVDLILSQEDI